MGRSLTDWRAARPVLDVLVGRAPLGVGFVDAELRFLYVNDTLAAIGGTPAASWLGQTLAETSPMLDAAVGSYLRHVLDTGEPLTGLRVTVGVRDWSASYYPLRTADGTLGGVGAVLADDTERDRAERLLRESEEQYRILVELSPDGIAMLEGECMTYINPAGVEILGATDASQILDRSVWDLVEPDRLPAALDELAKVLAGREPRAFDAPIRRLDGSAAILSVRSVTVDRGGVPAVQSIFRDVTARRAEQAERDRTREELRIARDELELRVAERTARLAEANERLRLEAAERAAAERQLRHAERLASIGTFGAGIAHEINNPLAAIVAAAELARALVADGDPRRELDGVLARIAEEAHRGGEIVKGILRFSREEASERWPLDVNQVARRLCLSALDTVLQRCRLRTRLARRLPSVLMNPTELEQILLNLLSNAAQAGARHVALRTDTAAGRIRIVVRDDGCGIDPCNLGRIFDPFFTTRQAEGGTGLGLSIVHGIVSRYEGDIQVRSRLGRGTSFTVQLPSIAATGA